MSDELGDLGEFRRFEEGVRLSLHDQADKVIPNHRLGAILDAEAPAKRRTGYWLIGVAAAFVLVAVLGLGFLLTNHTQGTAASGAAAPAQNDQAGKQGAVTQEVATPAASTSATAAVVALTYPALRRALAWLRGQDYVSPALVQELAPEVFRHRVGLTYEAEAEEVTADKIIAEVLAKTPVPAVAKG